MKYIVAFLLLFALTTELHLKSNPPNCKMSGENCTSNAQCCDRGLCLSKKHVCGSFLEFAKERYLEVEERSHKEVGEKCAENHECEKPNFCYDKKCTEPFEKGHECLDDYQCKSKKCSGFRYYGKCT